MFDKILIANRGEIACRIARTCRQLGIRTVAVYSDADREALHVAACDEARWLGPAPARDSYLRAERIIEIALASGAPAIHPGYGFLSENAGFAEACEQAGVVFIGPPADAIRAMGSKSAAKAIMEDAGVPLVPGYHGDDQDPALLAAESERIGYPVLIKASAGGGGKGMRVVEHPAQFDEALAAARREADKAFGDERVLVERYLTRPRHIEIQVFADTHGNVVHLFERDCSVQRRHQKIIEEAPAPGMTPERRTEMGSVAVAAARAIGYVGAGTVEFIAEPDGRFYFMEMNTRLQVEHPVTELITGRDLVEWQLRVAAGEPLPSEQNELCLSGHAFEVRIYAEDPDRDFLPATGRLKRLHTPVEDRHVRIDSGVREGDEIGIHYDPMIAKLIVHDRNRKTALRRLQQALSEFRVIGLTTNLALLERLTRHPAFAAGEVDTGFIARHREALLPPPAPAPDPILALATLAELLRIEARTRALAAGSTDPHSPWHSSDGWRLNSDNHHTLVLRDGEREVTIIAHFRPDHYLLELPGGRVRASGTLDAEGQLRYALDDRIGSAGVLHDGHERIVLDGGGRYRLLLHDPLTAGMDDEVIDGSLSAPMPGNVIAILVKPGERVAAGDPLLVLEAMKMEHTLRAPGPGVIGRIHYAVGEPVREGVELLSIETGE